MRMVGNRRSEEELESLKIANNKTIYKLDNQLNFNGTEDQLEMMQRLERSYIDGEPKISDEEWDLLKTKFHYEESLAPESPSGRKWRKFSAALPSLNKAGNLSELDDFLNNFEDGQEFVCECKLDGLSANLFYELSEKEGLYVLNDITSRGNGRYGLSLNPFALAGVNWNFPSVIKVSYVKDMLGYTPEFLEMRGEAVVPKNDITDSFYGKNAVLRSISSGMFNRKVPFNLKGLIAYLYNGKETLQSLTKEGFYEFKPEFSGRSCTNPEVLERAKMMASLISDYDTEKFLRGDYTIIYSDGSVEIVHKSGNTFKMKPYDEQLDIVIYSVAIDGSNVDISKLNKIPGFKYISDVEFDNRLSDEDINHAKKVYRITSDKESIKSAIADFYGTDPLTGVRDFNKPRTRNMYEYAMDGVVIKPTNSDKRTQNIDFRNNKNNPNKIVCPKYPEDQIAVKLLSEPVKVKLVSIEESVTSLGNKTCSGTLDKSYLTESGAMVSNINLHNPEWLAENSWIQPGNEYWMVMAMDIIPQLLDPRLFPI